jgi:hypothetical protein
MGGGLMQLVAYGAQDVYLTGNPQITFWKVTYRRHTNFAMESIEQTFNGQADFGRRVQCTVSRNGDLCYRTYLQVTLPQVGGKNCYARWLDNPGHQLISMVEVEIGGQRIDRQYGDWMHIWNQLTLTSEQEDGYHKMIGNTTQLTFLTDPNFADVATACSAGNTPQAVCAPRRALPETTLYVPLEFWFCRNPGLALPLIALQYHEVKINIELRPMDEVLWAVKGLDNATASANQGKDTASYQKSLVAASLYVDYVFLDTDERRRMAQNPHEYLIEQLQFTGDESIGSSSNKVKLNFNHPCKEIIWVVQPDKNVSYCDSFEADQVLNMALGAQPFNYTDAIDALPNSIRAFSSTQQLEGTASALTAGGGAGTASPGNANSVIDATGLFNDRTAGSGLKSNTVNDDLSAAAVVDISTAFSASVNNGVSDAGAFVLCETSRKLHCWGENPVVTAKLQLNGQDRFSEREGTYFDLVQPFQHHTRHPDTGINVYSFALRPEEHQPSGTCNFSRIDNATLQLVVSAAAIGSSATAKVRVYATNYNVLRVMSGMGGLAYSN